MVALPEFYVVSGATVKDVIDDCPSEIFSAIEKAYRLHAAGESINPDSYFLRFPEKPRDRIIALPARLGGDVQRSGLKWIASFPENTAANLARASAVQILNDPGTGYPVACMEASLISATRTAASAALGAEALSPSPLTGTLCIVGTGVIARATFDWLKFRGWSFDRINLFDLKRAEAERFAQWLRSNHDERAEVERSLGAAISNASLIVFTTTALEPYLDDPDLCSHAPTILHLSLRDIAVNVILEGQNFVDDIDHCLKQRTSVHLAEMETGNRDFIAGTLIDVLDKKCVIDPKRPRIFSPFGLGVLDIAIADLVLDQAIAREEATVIPDFFSNSLRW